MTAEIIAERITDRTCDRHRDTQIVEVFFRSDKLRNDWVLGICPRCQEDPPEIGGPCDTNPITEEQWRGE